LKNLVPRRNISAGIKKLVILPNKATIRPARYAPKMPKRFCGGTLGLEV